MQVVQTKRKSKNLLLKLALAILAIYAVVCIVNQQIVIAEKKQEVNSLNAQLQNQQMENAEMREMSGSENNEEYLERAARESLGYGYGDETQYVFISGE